ncbi:MULTISPECIES: hypothetical protein [Nguyenibacter]|uniref:Uncharacterized protein n=1 Tax=Nguyenibacter vanlangensis TaxID=1216886 RepID=A0A7Y7IY32_9PROT|nr:MULTISPECIES: hypothetical protein [Nguyenibacter]NVN11986.1 hypothetical protein [Nguyenibacter vanlangensis]WRH87327.1 hypothetical protein QN315_15325 [Nguyenibacter sp. L1]
MGSKQKKDRGETTPAKSFPRMQVTDNPSPPLDADIAGGSIKNGFSYVPFS